jgi:biotin carboxyl carrier protein
VRGLPCPAFVEEVLSAASTILEGLAFVLDMMKLRAGLAGENYQLLIRREGRRVVAEVDDRHYELEAIEAEQGVYLLLSGGHVYECRVNNTDLKDGVSEIHVGQQAFEITLIDPKRLRHTPSESAEASGRIAVVAAMPGKVVRVMVEAGAVVEAGTGLVVVEAMKMQNEMKSPKAGKVTEVKVAAGATVNAGDVLAVVE